MEKYKVRNAILYCRVSSDEQAKGCSLNHQEKELRYYCNKNNIKVVDVYKEDYSAKTFNRPEMNKISKRLLKKKPDADLLLVLRWNRFTRDLTDGCDYIKKFKQYGVEVNAIEEYLDHSIAESKLMLSLHLSMAEVDNEKRSRATKDGIHQSLLEGKCTNRAPRGYKNIRINDYEKSVAIDENIASLIRYAFEEVAKGVKTPTCVWRELKIKGLKVSESSFFEMLRNRFYIGDIFVPAYNNDPDQYVKGLHEPLVDKKLFYQVQERLNTKKKKNEVKIVKAPKEEFYLKSFMECPHCGAPIRASFSSGRKGVKYPYYHCNDCAKFRVRAENGNDVFLRYLSQIKPHPAVLALYNEVLADIRKECSKGVENKKDELNTELLKINDRYATLQDRWLDGLLDNDLFKQMSERLKQQQKDLQDKLDMLEIPKRAVVEPQIGYTISFISNMDKCLSAISVDAKIDVLGSILDGKIVIDNKKCRTAKFNSVISLIVGKSDIYTGENEKRSLSFTETPLLYPEPGSKIVIFCNATKSDEMYIISRYTIRYKG